MKIAVLLSGGVDSSVALRLLKEQGHNLTAFYIKIWLEDELSFLGECPWKEDLDYSRAVCEQAGVPLHVVSLQKEYWGTIVSYTLDEIKAGRTPNPDVLCNKCIKFGLFLNYIDENFDFDKIATGHYAHINKTDSDIELVCSPDPIKDQTYFLAYLDKKQLERALFPIGYLTKNQVRELAKKFDLPNKERKDSQGICFLGKVKFNEFIKHHLGECMGDLIEYESGKKLGEHKGFWFYTIGQRQGSGLPGGPWYVVAKDPEDNKVYLSRNYYAQDKHRDTFTVSQCNWIAGMRPNKKELRVKMRHGKYLHDCLIDYLPHDDIRVKLFSRDQGIAPGQFAVFYDGDICLGSGIISQV